jgi:hypothetical protein
MNKLLATGLESKFHVFDMRTYHDEEGYANVSEKVRTRSPLPVPFQSRIKHLILAHPFFSEPQSHHLDWRYAAAGPRHLHDIGRQWLAQPVEVQLPQVAQGGGRRGPRKGRRWHGQLNQQRNHLNAAHRLL